MPKFWTKIKWVGNKGLGVLLKSYKNQIFACILCCTADESTSHLLSCFSSQGTNLYSNIRSLDSSCPFFFLSLDNFTSTLLYGIKNWPIVIIKHIMETIPFYPFLSFYSCLLLLFWFLDFFLVLFYPHNSAWEFSIICINLYNSIIYITSIIFW